MTRRGVVATSGALFRAARRLPANVATELPVTGADLGGQRAYDLGFVNRLTSDGQAPAVAMELADLICRSSPLSVSETQRAQRAVPADEERCGWAATATARQAIRGSADSSPARPPGGIQHRGIHVDDHLADDIACRQPL